MGGGLQQRICHIFSIGFTARIPRAIPLRVAAGSDFRLSGRSWKTMEGESGPPAKRVWVQRCILF